MKRPRSADAQRAVTGALRSAINDHGPITKDKITSAAARAETTVEIAKRLAANRSLKKLLLPLQPVERTNLLNSVAAIPALHRLDGRETDKERERRRRKLTGAARRFAKLLEGDPDAQQYHVVDHERLHKGSSSLPTLAEYVRDAMELIVDRAAPGPRRRVSLTTYAVDKLDRILKNPRYDRLWPEDHRDPAERRAQRRRVSAIQRALLGALGLQVTPKKLDDARAGSSRSRTRLIRSLLEARGKLPD